MRPETLANEAQECREFAREFVGKPEQSFLLQLAGAFEELALQEDSRLTLARKHRPHLHL